MSNRIPVSEDDLIKNPTPRVPIVLCLDTSYSMAGDPIDELQEGVKKFFHSLYEDEIAKHSAEVSVVTFGGTVEEFIEFTSLSEEPPTPLASSRRTYADGRGCCGRIGFARGTEEPVP